MLAWFGELTAKERRTMGACFGGWALDAFDVQMYSFVIPTVIALWGVSRGEAGLIGTVTLLISSLGGWFSGTLADRFGRVRMLQITILWYSIFTFLCAFAQNFEQLFVLRALHGLGFGGEWAAGAVLMGEVIRDKYRGRGVGIVQTGWAVGWGASALIYTALYAFLPEAIAWRVLFAIGLLPAIFVFWIRRHIDEPEIFRDRQRTRPTIGVAHLFSAFHEPYLWTTVKVTLMVSGAQGGGYALLIWMPTYLRTVRGLSATGTGAFSFGPDPGRVVRLSVGFASERCHRPQIDLYAGGDRLARDDRYLHVCTEGQHRTPVRRYPAFHNIPDEIPANGAVHD
jgi:MFS family permease